MVPRINLGIIAPLDGLESTSLVPQITIAVSRLIYIDTPKRVCLFSSKQEIFAVLIACGCTSSFFEKRNTEDEMRTCELPIFCTMSGDKNEAATNERITRPTRLKSPFFFYFFLFCSLEKQCKNY